MKTIIHNLNNLKTVYKNILNAKEKNIYTGENSFTTVIRSVHNIGSRPHGGDRDVHVNGQLLGENLCSCVEHR